MSYSGVEDSLLRAGFLLDNILDNEKSCSAFKQLKRRWSKFRCGAGPESLVSFPSLASVGRNGRVRAYMGLTVDSGLLPTRDWSSSHQDSFRQSTIITSVTTTVGVASISNINSTRHFESTSAIEGMEIVV